MQLPLDLNLLGKSWMKNASLIKENLSVNYRGIKN